MKPFSGRSGRRRLAVATSALLAAVAVGVLALAGSASSKTATLAVGKSVEVGSKTESIAVTPKGAPVYELSPETAKHLLCSSGQCLSFWPPVKVAKGAKLTKGAGLKGRLGTLKRKGFDQLTLNGHPLYTFSQDTKKGEAHGEGIKGFGGTWHVFKEAGASQPAPTGGLTTSTTSTTTQTATSTNPYGY
jgi:predicted lipoprotein with Yx(FWY)xxD motif